jgi:hypothetical protein
MHKIYLLKTKKYKIKPQKYNRYIRIHAQSMIVIIFIQSIFVINMQYLQHYWQNYGNVNDKDEIYIDKNWF